ncbi:tetratricopeptide repeat protein [Polynucleobacter sp. MWH-Aus1W21]|uniref:tetratricopeptide repeat protein n=1 Tax=Polynucleobacter sp. MWH-Aus1W21 TaxID=1855880 RepID=UPI001BFDF53C|nr:hypothetical protein [Polynucleobacter sp. MWH-Aus1W21]QWD65251.1 hypothetical protein ICW03_06145 [Polynucleobacter sp. MWH-Aus1W21]
MNNRTYTSILLLVMGLVFCSALRAQPLTIAPQFDPYLPGELNERALYSLKEGDIPTAVILLERAYLLNPHSPDIKVNLELVRKIDQDKSPIQVGGEVVYLDALGNAVSPEKTVDVPALWPDSPNKSKP